MSCGCKKCNQLTPVCNTCACPTCTAVCTALVVANSWNVPACGQFAILSIPGLTTVLIGGYIYNPTYGQFKITAFDSLNSLLTVQNECVPGNAAPGTVVPALTSFVFSAPPTFVNLSSSSAWAIPDCDDTVVIDAPGLSSVVIGSYIWNPDYGYFRVTAFNNVTDELTVVNDCFAVNAAVSTVVPVGTLFLFVDGPPSVESADGWSEAREEWTYNSATSINVPSDATVKYSIGDKLWVVQGGVDKYFSVTGVAPTLLDITGGDDYTLTNVAIDSPKYSHEESPVGFPPFFAWTPVSITGSGAMTVVVDSVDQARFRVVDKNIEFDLTARLTLGGVGDSQLNVAVPADMPWFGDNSAFSNFICHASDVGGDPTGLFRLTNTPGIIVFKLGVNFAVGAATIGIRGSSPIV